MSKNARTTLALIALSAFSAGCAALADEPVKPLTPTQVREVNGLNSRAENEVAAQKLDDAIKHLEQAFALDPKNKQAATLMSAAYTKLGKIQKDSDEAARDFEKAVYFHSTRETVHNLNEGLKRIGKDPNSLKDRVVMGQTRSEEPNPLASQVEYEAAQRILDGKLKAFNQKFARVQDNNTDEPSYQ